jgi:uncharacterized protein (DUF362 family)
MSTSVLYCSVPILQNLVFLTEKPLVIQSVENESVVALERCPSYEPKTVRTAVENAVNAIGGFGRFVSTGARVLVKPNLLSAQPPEKAITTNPAVLRAVLELVLEAGGKPFVGDSPSSHKGGAEYLWSRTGLLPVCRDLGIELVRFEADTVNIRAADGKHELCLARAARQADIIISLPKFKTHSLTLLTCAVKNMFGVVPGYCKTTYHFDYPGPEEFADMLVSVFVSVRPALSIVDAVIGMEGNGPGSGGRPRYVGLVIAGTDAVAIDTVCAHLMGLPPQRVLTTKLAARRGLGTADLSAIRVIGPRLDDAKPPRYRLPIGLPLRLLPSGLMRIVERLLWIRPSFRPNCRKCGECSSKCPANAIRLVDRKPMLIDSKCIRCLCCLEACPYDAIAMKYSFLAGTFLQ